MNILSRKDAAFSGLPRFFTGKPCKYGHLSERYVTTGACIQCLRAFSAQYRQAAPSHVVPSVRLAAYVHPADAEKVYQTIDYLNKTRGLPPAVRPASTDGTPWELYVRSWLTRPVNLRPSLASVRSSAIARGIAPDRYSPGATPFEEWTVSLRTPNFAAVKPDEGYAPDETPPT